MKLKYLRILHLIFSLCWIGLLISIFLQGDHVIKDLLFIVFLVLAAYLDYNFWRCPSCERYLGKRMWPSPKQCPSCGHPILLDERVNRKK